MTVLLPIDLLNTEQHLFPSDHHKDRKSQEAVECSYSQYRMLIPNGYPTTNHKKRLELPSFVSVQQNNNFQTDILPLLHYATSFSQVKIVRSWTLTFWQTTEGILTIDRWFVMVPEFRMTVTVIIRRKVPSTSWTVEISHFRERLKFSIVLLDDLIVWCSQWPIQEIQVHLSV